ncbi:hypothetical protein F5613_000060 [Macellibacteroides fermentans]|uniref:Uncharacterized protein n=1 Tax=Macellibacteroides fermentans TaxID=879969 RepID=A0A8E1ZUF6_9PORP|nr:hypothetical protein [Macellibacteroides fermentans]
MLQHLRILIWCAHILKKLLPNSEAQPYPITLTKKGFHFIDTFSIITRINKVFLCKFAVSFVKENNYTYLYLYVQKQNMWRITPCQ